MAKKVTDKISQDKLSGKVYKIFDITRQESSFITILAFLTFICGVVSPYPQVAMWVGFMLAAYSAIANDSIQTIGTFIASNQKKRWWVLWLFIGGIFVATVTVSYIIYDGDVTYQRLSSKGFSEAPTSFTFLQLSAPLILLILTRLRMPVSTTFLLLNVFATDANAVWSVMEKSFTGYFIAFLSAIAVWFFIGSFVKKYFKGKPWKYWIVIQWITSGCLWSVWIQQDAANIAIFLPRTLEFTQFLAFTTFIFLGLGLLFYLKGDKIQRVVDEKSGVTDVRAATIVDFVYAIVLFYFQSVNTIPMSTTWVFIGLLGGRELAISLSKRRKKKRARSLKKSFRMVRKDLMNATIGLIISLMLAVAINKNIQEEVMNYFFP